jgi:hypothetical protein
MTKSDPIFINKPEILIHKDHLFDFIPNKGSREERLNATVRFAGYMSILLTLVKGDYRYLYIVVAVAGIIFFFYQNNIENFSNKEKPEEENSEEKQKDKQEKGPHDSYKLEEQEESENCQEPSPDNPFMNILLTDDYSKRKKACNYTRETTDKVDKIYHDKLFMDTDLVYNPDASSRQFYSTPSTQIPNDQGSFAKWCYQTPVSCAGGNNVLLKQDKTCALANVPLSELVNEKSNFYCLGNESPN